MISISQDHVISTGELSVDQKFLGGTGYVCFNYMQKHRSKIAQIDAETGHKDTFNDLLQRSIRTAIWLQRKEIEENDIVVYFSGIQLNSPVPVLASYFIGAIPSVIDTTLSPDEISHLLKLTTPKILFTVPEGLEVIETAVKTAGIVTELLVFDKTSDNECLKPQKTEDEFRPIYLTDLKRTVAIHFSSGSTGYPKAICVSHYILMCNQLSLDHTEEGQDLERNEFVASKTKDMMVLCSYDSLYWNIEVIRLIQSIVEGNCRLIDASFDAQKIWLLIDKYKVNVLCLIPFDITAMCRAGKPKCIDTSSLISLMSVGSKLATKYFLTLQELLPTTDIYQGYGQTECGPITEFNPKNKKHRDIYLNDPQCVGFPIPGFSYRIVDLETGKNLGPNQQGELYVKTKKIMNGYYRQDIVDEIDEDGWLKTGDIMYYTENFQFYIEDRIKNFLICQGWHITPVFLENLLLDHPAVNKAVVLGIPDDENGENPVGIVVLDKNYPDVTAEEIKEYVDKQVIDRNRLRGGVIFMDNLPMTPTGKVKRRALKKWILEGNS